MGTNRWGATLTSSDISPERVCSVRWMLFEMNGVWLNGVYNPQVFNRRGLSTAPGQTTNLVLLEGGVGGGELGLLCILSMCTHTPPVAVVLKALLCVCEGCESCTDREHLKIILKVNISLADICLSWWLLSPSEDLNLPRCTRDTSQACVPWWIHQTVTPDYLEQVQKHRSINNKFLLLVSSPYSDRNKGEAAFSCTRVWASVKPSAALADRKPRGLFSLGRGNPALAGWPMARLSIRRLFP